MTTALVIFVAAYALMAGLRLPGLHLDRPGGAIVGAVAMVAVGVVPDAEAVRKAIDFDTLALLFGMMVVSAYLAEAGLFRYASWATLTHVRTPRRLVWALVFVAGLLSAFLVNDTVCLMFTPVVVQLARDARLRPLPLLLALAFGANAGSVATPTGNPQNMIIGTLSGISYARFTAALALPALASLTVVAVLLQWLFRDDLHEEPIDAASLARPTLDPRLAMWSVGTLVATVVAFLAGAPMAWTAMLAGTLLLCVGGRSPREILGRVDYVLLAFLAGLFVVVNGVGRAGIAAAMFDALSAAFGQDPAAQALTFGGFTVMASQVVSNVPFVMLAGQWMPRFAEPKFMWLSTALFATLAGNLTIVGSVANMIVLESAGKDGRISFVRFLRYGATVTLATLAVSFLILWSERAMGWL